MTAALLFALLLGTSAPTAAQPAQPADTLLSADTARPPKPRFVYAQERRYTLGARTLLKGHCGGDVKELVELLARLQFIDPGEVTLLRGGYPLYDRVVARAVAAFQRSQGLYADGIANKTTIDRLLSCGRACVGWQVE